MNHDDTTSTTTGRCTMHEPIPEDVEALGTQALDGAFKVHRALGPGLFESAYRACLSHELRKFGLAFE